MDSDDVIIGEVSTLGFPLLLSFTVGAASHHIRSKIDCTTGQILYIIEELDNIKLTRLTLHMNFPPNE